MLKQVQLSPSAGLSVSQLCLGTMNFGIPGRGHQGDWTLDVDAARPIFESAKTLGLTYFDCANVYGLGASEEVVGQLLSEIYARDEFVLTTKVAMPMGRSATQGGLSRKHILESVEQSLERLGLDYVDQLIIHRHPTPFQASLGFPSKRRWSTPRRRKSGDGTLPRRVLNVCVAVRGLTSCRQGQSLDPVY